MKSTHRIRRKLKGWGVPFAYAITTLVLGMIIPRVEHHYFPNLVSTISAASAMAICSSIASGMIALTGIVFSLAIIMVQFSATAYSPRLVLWVARDSVVSHALGVFTATFLYALQMLAWVDRESSGKVPFVSGWLVFVLLLASVGMFVALIERVGLLQVTRMLIFTADQGRQAIEELYPLWEDTEPMDLAAIRKLPLTQTLAYSGRPRIVQSLQVGELLALACTSKAVIEVTSAIGDSVLEKSPLLRVYSAQRPLDENALRNAMELGDERTFQQDPKYAMRLVVDIAIKALSPAINDPTTAVQALDQIEDMLLRLGQRRLQMGVYRDENNSIRLVVPFPKWEDFLRLGLDEIRFCGANSIQVMRRMNALIKNLLDVLPAVRHPELRRWEQRLQATVERAFTDE
ncbi:MAG TPA: DUF2254 domain-containing protein, partial [Verrucomicrobiota bacterium]|nr:DUF2254 domain-containing protein [Verrucomicrobiota bacterium]